MAWFLAVTEKSFLSSNNLGSRFLHKLRGAGRVWIKIPHQPQNAPPSHVLGEAGGRKSQASDWIHEFEGLMFTSKEMKASS